MSGELKRQTSNVGTDPVTPEKYTETLEDIYPNQSYSRLMAGQEPLQDSLQDTSLFPSVQFNSGRNERSFQEQQRQEGLQVVLNAHATNPNSNRDSHFSNAQTQINTTE